MRQRQQDDDDNGDATKSKVSGNVEIINHICKV